MEGVVTVAVCSQLRKRAIFHGLKASGGFVTGAPAASAVVIPTRSLSKNNKLYKCVLWMETGVSPFVIVIGRLFLQRRLPRRTKQELLTVKSTS